MNHPIRSWSRPRRLQLAMWPLLVLSVGCGTESQSPDLAAPADSAADSVPNAPTVAFAWGSATPESQGMCGSTLQLGCTSTLEQIWTAISDRKHNSKRFAVIRNDMVVYDQGGTEPYYSYS